MLARFISTLLCIAGCYVVVAQSYIGLRETINFQKHQYNAGTQNWQIRQDKMGRMYFANNEGVLSFDGTYWQLYPLPNKTIVWSIEFGKDNCLYAGGQDELGYFSANKSGQLVYTSLRNLLPESDQKFADIWNIVSYGNDVFFRSTTKLFKYSNHAFTVYPPTTAWLFVGMHQQQLLAHDEKRGLLLYKNGSWERFVDRSALPKDFYITSIIPLDAQTSLLTTKSGLYTLGNNGVLQPFLLTSNHINTAQLFASAVALDAENFIVSTYTNGIYQINSKGSVIDHVSKNEGLQNSNVRSVFTDKNKNIWLGLDNGIDFIPYNNAIKHINPSIFNDGAGYAITAYKQQLYFALSTGIYTLPLQANTDISYTQNLVSSIANGQSWQLSVVGNQLLAGREEGFAKIDNNRLVPIDASTGYWIFQSFTQPNKPQLLAAGNYLGVHLFETNAQGTWLSKGAIPQLNTSARFLAIDSSNTIWVSHPYRGVYRINAQNAQVTLYTQTNGLPSTLNNHVYKVKNKVVVATERGIYEFQKSTNRFVPVPFFKDIFGNRSIRYLKEDSTGNIWFVQDKSLGVLDVSGSKPSIIYLPELKGNILSGFENVYPLNNNNVFVGGEKGFYHINYSKYKQNMHSLGIYLRGVKAMGKTDSVLFGGYFAQVNNVLVQTAQHIPEIDHAFNSLHFEYASPVFQHQMNVEYSYCLEGFDKQWSVWSDKTEKDYTNLPAGKYIFKVKARNNLNTESEVATYTLVVQAPWYQTVWAYLCYLLLGTYLLYSLYKWQEKKHLKKQADELLLARKKYEAEQQQIAYKHQLALEKSEKEVIQLKYEKLESESDFKTAELASTAMNLVQKKEFIFKIKEELQLLSKSGKQNIETGELKKILRILSEEEKLNEEWEQFSIHFNKVHGDFLNIIKEKYPDLNAHELKLCAYLRMNLTSKEIAHLMSISVRGVEISRYRLRKKLGIATETNLFQFLFDLQRNNRPT